MNRSVGRTRGGRDAELMRRALDLARRGFGETNPNPMVGCVIARGGTVVGEGWHRRAGGPHAEALALAAAGSRARGATAYVNLEPCCPHPGKRMPPCAPALVRAGVKRVVVGLRDPNPAVDGRGMALLRRAGIEVVSGVLEADARALNARFAVAQARRRPFVLLKAAITLDGRIATLTGDSRWITSGSQRAQARRLRRAHDGVVVGIGTALRDDPLLLPSPRTKRPFHRIVLDSRLRLPLSSRLVRSARRSPLVVVTLRGQAARRRRLEERGVTVLETVAKGGRVALKGALMSLWHHGLRSLMVEGGGEVLGSFLAERLFDEVALFRAPLLLGGSRSLPAFGGPSPRRLRDALALDGPRLPAFELWYPRR